MLINFDYLSPSIYLYYSGNRGHLSNIGGLLTILLILSILMSALMIICSEKYQNPKISFYREHQRESNMLFFNESELFHFYSFNNLQEKKLNFNKYIRIYSFNSYSNDFKQYSLTDNDHWLYDLCEDGIDNNFFDKSILDKITFFSECICLKYFYNSIDKKYYAKNDSKFRTPHIKKDDDKIISYDILVEKCINDTLFNNQLKISCASENEINNFISNNSEIILYYHTHKISLKNKVMFFL